VAGAYCFDRFELDPTDRRLTADGQAIELSGRYLDALILLVAEEGRLVSKARFLDEVWKGVPVTDEALTQCIRSLRKALGDEAGRPRFIETAPRYGYRFITPVTRVEANLPVGLRRSIAQHQHSFEPGPRAASLKRREALERFVGQGRAGLLGGGAAGLIGGLAYGFAGVAGSAGGAMSGLLVVAVLTAVIGMMGGAGVGFGVGSTAFISRQAKAWLVIGGAFGGIVVGAVVRLVGLDALSLLFGAAPDAMTGAGEGLLLGAGIGCAIWLAHGRQRVAILSGAALTGMAGSVASMLGGHLMGGSLAALAEQFPQARLRLDDLGSVFGEETFGPVSQAATAGMEGALFGAAVVLALTLERRRSGDCR